MVIAGEASGDLLAAELVKALRAELQSARPPETTDLQPLRTGLAPQFFGAGGPKMQEAGVELAFDMTAHAIMGLGEAFKVYFKFRRLFGVLLRLALERQPEVILLVDFSGFNRRFASAIRRYVRARLSPFRNWRPKIVYYVSPQVWASRPGRALALACDVDLLLSIFPFEKAWYARRVPQLHVEFVGHPLVDRYARVAGRRALVERHADLPLVLLLPGSREAELRRHLPVLLPAAKQLAVQHPVRFLMILPSENLLAQTKSQVLSMLPELRVQAGGLAAALTEAELAIAKSGTITLECAYFGVPAVVFYKTSWASYLAGRLGVTVPYLAMPNLLAGEMIYPELIQNAATVENLARAALELLTNPTRRDQIKTKLARVVQSLGPSGAAQRAARTIVSLLQG
jgi:lipid-A-disaccharide synthase